MIECCELQRASPDSIWCEQSAACIYSCAIIRIKCMALASFCAGVRAGVHVCVCGGAGAVNLPLFSNAERAVVGKSYKSNGKEAAIRTGVRFVTAQWREMVATVAKTAGPAPADVYVYCWRGGMRSGSVAALLTALGYRATTLSGGYKGFRAWGRAVFTEHSVPVVIIRGRTGSGKTELIKNLGWRPGVQVCCSLTLPAASYCKSRREDGS